VLRQLGEFEKGMNSDASRIEDCLQDIYHRASIQLDAEQKISLMADVINEVNGFGPIQPLLDDPAVTEVMVNGPKHIYIEKSGKLQKTDVCFDDNAHVVRVIEKIVLPLGRRIDAESPTVDARLPDGSRVNAVVPPVAIDGPSLTIRKFSKESLTVTNLIEFGSITEMAAKFLRACVEAKLNVIISGGTGSGKTTLLNILSGFIPATDRIVTIEDSAELQLQQDHVVRLETQPPNIEHQNEVSIRDLVRNSLRMRPDRIVVGEVRGGEAIDMLQAMNTGHDGSLTTLHANSPRDGLSRLETMAMMSGMDLPIRVIREQIASAVDVIVQQSRFADGTRKVTYITEVSGMEGDTIVMTDVFKFKQQGIADDKILGELSPTGIRPLFSEKLKAAGFDLGPELFRTTG
jgi:pilus assembly protein CpaF